MRGRRLHHQCDDRYPARLLHSDSFDTGFSYESASELRVKLKSRQTMWMAAGRKDVNFTETDVVPSLCAEINVLAYQWALNHSSPAARSRFQDIGEVLEMGKDLGPYNAGPLWIYNALKYNNAKDKSKVVIQAPMMHTPFDYKIKAAAGFHYCKLLSPARALEWIYIDGLRAKGELVIILFQEEKLKTTNFIYNDALLQEIGNEKAAISAAAEEDVVHQEKVAQRTSAASDAYSHMCQRRYLVHCEDAVLITCHD